MKRKVRFTDEKDDADEIPNARMRKVDPEELIDNLNAEPSTSIEHEKKHTLDSDEEDEPDKYTRFDAEKFEGQEEATQEYDGKTKIMAFNMKEDMEEGHFASDGTFIFNKKEDVIKDAWLDNINWDNVKNSAGALWQPDSETVDDAAVAAVEEKEETVNVSAVYERLLELLEKPMETIGAALKRLNMEKGLTAAEERKQRWAAKKAGVPFETGNSKLVSELTSLTDSLISTGHMSAYQLNVMQIRERLEKMKKPHEAKVDKAGEPEPFDMFGDDESLELASSSNSAKEEAAASEPVEAIVMWEFRVKDKEGNLTEKLHGPYSSDKMETMKETELLKYGGMVRKLGTDTFYDVKRIDFDLYS